MSIPTNPFGNAPGKPAPSPFGNAPGKPAGVPAFGQAPAPAPAPPAAPAAPSAAAPPPANAARRRQVGEAPAVNSGAPPPADDDKRGLKVEGLHFCYLDSVGTTKGGDHNFKVKIVGGPCSGAEVMLNMTKGGFRVRKFFTESGLPDTKWPRDANGKPSLPVPSMFLRTVQDERGGLLYVPILMVGKFSLGENKQNNADPFQNFDWCRPVRVRYIENGTACESFVIAPAPGFLPPAVGPALGWPGQISQYGSYQVDRRELLAMDPIFGEKWRPLDGHSTSEVDLSTVKEVIE